MWLAVKLVITLLSIPLMRMELSFLPKWFSDYSYGLMFRLGLLFGLVVVVWNSPSHRQLLRLRNALFLLASIASALITIVFDDLAHGGFGMLLITVSGAVCLALSQRFILGASWKQVIAAVILAPAFFYLVWYGIDKFLPEGASAKQFLASYMPYCWQLGYLLGMFGVLDLMQQDAPDSPPVA
jgi:hypothetical protein